MRKLSFLKIISSEEQMLELGGELASVCGNTAIIFLYGDLGAGKTTLTRGFLRGLNYPGKVKSPTYTLVESYEIDKQKIYHFDFYRLSDPHELEFIGIQDYFHADSVSLIEWPQNGVGILPAPDLSCYLDMRGEGREVSIEANTSHGNEILKRLIGTQG